MNVFRKSVTALIAGAGMALAASGAMAQSYPDPSS